jgi:hypothetical protein
VSALIVLAGIAGTRLLRPYFLPPRLTGGSLPRFTTEGLYRAVANVVLHTVILGSCNMVLHHVFFSKSENS